MIQSSLAVGTSHAESVSAQSWTRVIHQRTTPASGVERNPEEIPNTTEGRALFLKQGGILKKQ